MRLLHDLSEIIAHAFAAADMLFHDGLHEGGIRPDFVLRAREAHAAPVFAERRFVVGVSVAVQTHDGKIGRKFKPAGEQFVEGGVVDIAAVEAADVRRPPGDARHRHMEPRVVLIAERLEGGGHVSAPHERAVLRASCPGAADEIDDVFFALRFHALVEGAGVLHGVLVGALERGTVEVAVELPVGDGVFGLRFVQPKEGDAVLSVIFLAAVPHECARLGVGGVEELFKAPAVHRDGKPPVDADEEIALLHLAVVDGISVDGRPDGDHQLHAHLVKLLRHCLRVGPIALVELPVALLRPVEEVDDDDVHGDVAAVIFARDGKQLFLRLIAQLALPEAEAVFGHHRGLAHDFHVRSQDVGRGVARRDPIVDLLGGAGGEFGVVGAERRPAHRRVVPEEPVAVRREQEGDARLRVFLFELERGALQIKGGLLILPHAEELFVVGLEAHAEGVVVSAHRAVFPARGAQLRDLVEFPPAFGAVFPGAVILFEEQFPLRVVKGDLAVFRHFGADISVLDDGEMIADLHFCRVLHGGVERPISPRKGAVLRGGDAETLPPGADPQKFSAAAEIKRAVLFKQKLHKFLPVFRSARL